jgi:dihydropteroate synthase
VSRPDGARRTGTESTATPELRLGRRSIALERVALMGVLNITPDSFSDGGRYLRPAEALVHAAEMVEQGAAIIDVGGESTRPGAQPVSASEEVDRVLPVIEALAGDVDVAISIDTTKPEVMRAAVAAGAVLINDVMALRAPGALETAADLGVGVCLMHMQGEPRTMQANPHYDDVVQEVGSFLRGRVKAALAAGIPQESLLIDPGFGFGKTLEHNLALLRGLGSLSQLDVPILAGLSRKSMIQKALGLPVEQRLSASLALALMAVQNGARILRVHDVAATRDAVRMWEAVYYY